jgi:hypothetical protein
MKRRQCMCVLVVLSVAAVLAAVLVLMFASAAVTQRGESELCER